MRNYCRLWFCDLTFQDQGPPIGPLQAIVLWDRDKDLLAQAVQNVYNTYASQTTTVNDSGQTYVLLDTDQVVYMCQQMGQIHVMPANQKDSPRDSWFPAANSIDDHYHGPESKDPGGPVGQPSKAKPGDFSGAQTLVELFLNLMHSLITNSDKRTAGIVQFELDEFLAGKASITQILQILRNDFII